MKFRILLVILTFLLGGTLFLLREVTKPLFSSPVPISLDVPAGSSVSEIATSLRQEGAAVSPLLFRLFWMLHGQTVTRAGHYELPVGTSLWDIFTVFEEGQIHLVKVMLPEGVTLSGAARRLEKAQAIASADEFIRLANDPAELNRLGLGFALSAEGFLFPDTYLFDRLSNERDVLEHLVQAFWKVIEEIVPSALEWDRERFYDTIKLASIVEKEYRREEEASLIASVFDSRLRRGMRLESCGTLVYILTEIQKKPHPSRIFWSDTEIDSTYNTYRNSGLTPTPIANAGRIALNAAFNPAKTDYLFFVVKNPQTGSHTFTGNFDDHSQAKTDYFNNFVVK